MGAKDAYLVLGMGKSGTSAARLLKQRGLDVHAYDDVKTSLPPDLSDVRLFTGSLEDFPYKHVIASPGLPQNHPVLKTARERRIPVISEIDLALEGYGGQVIAVTGTNGKSTTSALIDHLIRKLGRQVAFGGNIGVPLSELAFKGLPDYLVLEISSYQAMGSFLLAPRVSVFTNFSSDHLEMHGTIQEYFKAKMRLIDQTLEDGHLVTESPVLTLIKDKGYLYPKNTVLSDQLPSSFYDDLKAHSLLQEPHNLQNAAQAVLGVSFLLNLDFKSILPHLRSFGGLEHRCEVVGRLGHSLIVNDSKATNVNSTLTALAAYEGRILLLLGGRPKQESMAPILKFKEKIARIITFGEAAAQVRRELSSLNVFEISHIQDLPSFLERSPVVEDTLLFSPACASFDQFKNFEDRGLQFKMIVKQLPGFK